MACRCCGGLSRRRLLSGAVAAAVLPLAGCDAAVPDWLADLLVPEALAAELGVQAFREILRETPPMRDPGLQRRVAAVGERIVAASASPWADWQFAVLDSPQRMPSPCPAAGSGCSLACSRPWPTRRNWRPCSGTRLATSMR